MQIDLLKINDGIITVTKGQEKFNLFVQVRYGMEVKVLQENFLTRIRILYKSSPMVEYVFN